MRAFLRQEVPGLSLLFCALGFGVVLLWPELEVTRAAPNDLVFHLTAAERLLDAFRHGEPLLDPWVSEWALGYPIWRSYQPLPHLLAAAVLGATDGFVDHTTAFAWLHFCLLVLWPASVYAGARLLGLRPLAAGLAAVFVIMPSASGNFDRYGLSYGAFVWRGSGLYGQLVALHALVLTLGLVARSSSSGKHRAVAGAALAITGLCHMVFGYVAGLSALVMALATHRADIGRRLVRLVVLAALALTLVAWFIVPLWRVADVINHCRWEDLYKWDSFGAPLILSELGSGSFFDTGRLAVLSVLLLAGAAASAWRIREPLPRTLLALTLTWLLVFFGRATWGQLLTLLGVPLDLHIHRVQAGFELCAVLTGAHGLSSALVAIRSRSFRFAAIAAVAVALGLMARERAAYLQKNADWGRESLLALNAESADLRAAIADVRTLLERQPGRTSTGLAVGWGGKFKVGATPVHGLLSRAHLDQATFLYHSMSKSSDIMVLRDEADAAQVDAFALRALVAPREVTVPRTFRRHSQHGRFVVYEGAKEGYFGLTDVTAVYTGSAETKYDPNSAWLKSRLPAAHQVIALQGAQTAAPELPRVAHWQALPIAADRGSCGALVREWKQGERYGAALQLTRECHALLKITWHPDLVARVDGKPAPLLEVTPGFGAVRIPAGAHRVEVRYEPGPLRAWLLCAGLFAFALAASYSRARALLGALELQLTAALARAAQRARTVPWAAAGSLVVLVVLALRPLLRGQLVDGHDATEYPPRLVQLAKVLSDGHWPPIWAPDLGSGYGQPLFEFAPPLVYLAALPFHLAGARLTNALQWGLFGLFTLGAWALYKLARSLGGERSSAVGVTAAWLFAPYTSLDLYVRGAFAEASAVAVAPLAAFCLQRCVTNPSVGSTTGAAISVALIMLGHNGAAILLLPALCLLVLALGSTARARLSGALAVTVGLGLSAYFWMPALLEKEHVQTDLLREGFLHWSQHAVTWWQLLHSAWGHGVSVAGSSDGMSFALGWPQLLLASLGVFAAVRGARSARRVASASALLACAGAWLATSASAFVWEQVTTLQYLAYPWRALMLPGLFLPLLGLWSLERLGERARMLAIAVVVLANIPHTEPKGYLTFDDPYYAPDSIARHGIRTTTREEYAPRTARQTPRYTAEKLRSPVGRVEVLSQRLSSAKQEFRVRASVPARAELATYAYPGWSATIDGEAAALTTVPRVGNMALRIPAGEHTLVLTLEPTVARRWSAWLSLLVAVGCLAALAVRAARSRRLARSRTTEPDEAPEHVPATRSGIYATEQQPAALADDARSAARELTGGG